MKKILSKQEEKEIVMSLYKNIISETPSEYKNIDIHEMLNMRKQKTDEMNKYFRDKKGLIETFFRDFRVLSRPLEAYDIYKSVSYIHRSTYLEKVTLSDDYDDYITYVDFLSSNYLFDNPKIFHLQEGLIELLKLTNIDKDMYLKLPFNNIFIDCSWEEQDIVVCGIQAYVGISKEDNHQCIVMFVRGFDKQDGGNFYGYRYIKNSFPVEFVWSKKKVEGIERFEVVENTAKKIVESFLVYLNTSDYVGVDIVPREEQNLKRIRRGKSIINPYIDVRLPKSFNLGRYKDSLSIGCFSHKFWVRGHFRHLKSKVFKEKRILWIKPYLKGEGILVDKLYNVSLGGNGNEFER